MTISPEPTGFKRPEVDPRPTKYHVWAGFGAGFVLPDGALDAAIADRCADVDSELMRRSRAPIAYAGSMFDADALARERIKGTLDRIVRGDGLPSGWVGWRDADNDHNWSDLNELGVRDALSGLSRSIEDREQALLIAAWQHKGAIRALGSVEDVIAHDIKAGWPAV